MFESGVGLSVAATRQCGGRFAGGPDGTISAIVMIVPALASERRPSHDEAAYTCPGAPTAVHSTINAPIESDLRMVMLVWSVISRTPSGAGLHTLETGNRTPCLPRTSWRSIGGKTVLPSYSDLERNAASTMYSRDASMADALSVPPTNCPVNHTLHSRVTGLWNSSM